MSTYMDLLRAHRAKQKAAQEKSGAHSDNASAGDPAQAPAPHRQPPLQADDDRESMSPPQASPLDDEVSDLARTALLQVGAESSVTTSQDAPAYVDMLRTHPGASVSAVSAEPEPSPVVDEEPEMPALSEAEMPALSEERETTSPAGEPEAPSLSEMPDTPPEIPASLSEEPLPQTPDAMMQDEFTGTAGDVGVQTGHFEASLVDETPDQMPQGTLLDLHEKSDATDQAAWLSGCVALLLRIYEDAGHNVPSDLSPLLMHLEKFTGTVYEDIERLNALELEISNHIDEFRNQHLTCGDLLEKAVMMMLYGIKVCMQMHMEPPEITRQVAAAMLHNIGMALILVDTRLKESTLSDVERALIRRTPEKSLEYLKDCGITDPVLLQAAEQAQERFDGSGPQHLAGTDIALSARITGLLSMFEALVHFRAYRERLLPRDAIRELVNRYKPQFDPAILKVLIESVSLYPVGTYVQLNSGDVGQVVRVQPRLPLRPKVLLTLDRDGNKIQPREVDLREQPNLMVQRCMYAAGLASLKQEGDKADGHR